MNHQGQLPERFRHDVGVVTIVLTLDHKVEEHRANSFAGVVFVLLLEGETTTFAIRAA